MEEKSSWILPETRFEEFVLSLQKDVFLFPNGFFYEYFFLSLLIFSPKQATQERETNGSPEQNILLVLIISLSMIYLLFSPLYKIFPLPKQNVLSLQKENKEIK